MERVARLRQEMESQGLDALVASSPDNVVYSAGFTVPSHFGNRFRRTLCLVPATGSLAMIVVTVEESLARATSAVIDDIRAYNEFTDDPMRVLADLLQERGLGAAHVGVEVDHLPAANFECLREYLPEATLVPAAQFFFEARMRKTRAEIETIRMLARQAANAHGRAFAQLRSGMTERDLGRLLIEACPVADYCHPIVGAGERSAYPNAAPTDRPIRAGDVVRVDLISGEDGFHSDVARTAVMEAADDEQNRVWSVLIDAYRRVQDRLRPGVGTRDLHRTYLRTLADAGLEASLKFLGHGLGLTIHEEPYVNEYTDRVLEPGMVICLEPMYLLPGRMGFHVEDEFLITDDGFELLSDATPNDQLIVVG